MQDAFSHNADKWTYGIMVKDKLGRPNIGFSYINKNKLGEQKQFNKRLMISISNEDYKALKKRAKSRKLSELIRTYIQWGLENDTNTYKS